MPRMLLPLQKEEVRSQQPDVMIDFGLIYDSFLEESSKEAAKEVISQEMKDVNTGGRKE